MLIAVFLAAVFKWSKIAAAGGVWITNPLTAPFIYGSSYLVGAKILGFKIASKLLTGADLPPLKEAGTKILLATTVGGIALGVPLALLAYGYQTKLKHRVTAKKEKLAGKIRRKKGKISRRGKYRWKR